MGAKEVALLILVAGGDEAFEPQTLKVVGEVVKEVAHARIVAIAIDCLATEVLGVVHKFLFDIGQLGIEFIFLGIFCRMQIAVLRFCCHVMVWKSL